MKYKSFILFLATMSCLSATDWQTVSRMPHPVYGGQAIVMDSMIYILGGRDSMRMPVDMIQVFDPRTGEWGIAGSMLLARYGFMADKLGDSLIVYCGGVKNNSRDIYPLETWNPYSDALVSNHIINSNSNFNRTFVSGHIYNGYLYLFGGMTSMSIADTGLPYIIQYDLGGNSPFSVREDLYPDNDLPYHQMTVRVDSLVYILGGSRFGVMNQVHSFNLNSFEMRHVINLRAPRAGGAAVHSRGNIYVLGGYNESTDAIRATEILNIYKNTDSIGAKLNFDRRELMAVNFYDQAIYVFGGKDLNGNTVSAVEKLDSIVVSVVSVEHQKTFAPAGFLLKENYPDPFNATTVIEFELKENGNTRLEIFATDGRHIKTLFTGFRTAGAYRYNWQGDDRNGIPVSSGIYIYRLISGNHVFAKKMALIR